MRRAAFVTIIVVFVAAASRAQSVPDPSGHWVGTVSIPNMPIAFEVDLARSAGGNVSGTISMPAQQLRGLPLSKVDVSGTSIAFEARTDQGFAGMLSADGTTITGDFAFQVYNFPFTLTRMGAAKIDPPATSAPISKALEGTWSGTLAAGGSQMHVVLTLANHPNGTSTGSLVNVDEGGLELPIGSIREQGASVTLAFKVIEGSFAGTVNADGTQITGNWTQGTQGAPLTFVREKR